MSNDIYVLDKDHNPIELSHLSPDDLVEILYDGNYLASFRDAAARELVKKWKDRARGITLEHLIHVGSYADEPYRSQANAIIRQHI